MNVKRYVPAYYRYKYGFFFRKTQSTIKIYIGRIKRLFHKVLLPDNEDNSKNLHLGPGPISNPYYINIDLIPLPHIHYIRPVDDLRMFDDETVDLIYACHVLEHFPHVRIKNVLKEWNRVLKSGGVLMLSVPDFGCILNVYENEGKDMRLVLNALFGGQKNEYDFHYISFDEKSLSVLLQETGFKEIGEWIPGSDKLTDMNDWASKTYNINGTKYPISLNLRAVKA